MLIAAATDLLERTRDPQELCGELRGRLKAEANHPSIQLFLVPNRFDVCGLVP